MSTQSSSASNRIGIRTPGVHHIALRVRSFEESRRFYVDLLGFEVVMEMPGLFLFKAGGTVFGVRAPSESSPDQDRFDPHRVGLDHIALACTDDAELQRVASALSSAGVDNTGVKLDDALGKDYVAFKDPDGIAWEYYMV